MAGRPAAREAVIRKPLQQIGIIRVFCAVFRAINARINKAPQIDHAGKPVLRKLLQIIRARFSGSLKILFQNVRNLHHERISRLCIRILCKILIVRLDAGVEFFRSLPETVKHWPPNVRNKSAKFYKVKSGTAK